MIRIKQLSHSNPPLGDCFTDMTNDKNKTFTYSAELEQFYS